MYNMSEDYYLRKCYFQQEQVPSISMMKKKMSPPLAAVYFKSMRPSLKVIAGLEPSLKGGGNDWYQPPQDLLEGRAVLKPVRKKVLNELNYEGIGALGTNLFLKHRQVMDLQIQKTLHENDLNWKNNITATTRQLWDNLVATAIKKNSQQIMNDFNCFAYLYRQSIGKIEILFHDSAIVEIRNSRERVQQIMKIKYETSLKQQATSIYDDYEKKLMDEKTRLKVQFMQNSKDSFTVIANKVHDLNVEKHKAIEKIKQCLQSQNLACQIYVALKEREECLKETEEIKHKHKKTMKVMKDAILAKDIEVDLAKVKEQKREEFCKTWQKKVCLVVKSFQIFVSYCLNVLPEYAEFFINMEKLMLLQLNETLEDSFAASIFQEEREQFTTPVPRPKPFYLFCDRGYKPEVDLGLCPKHSGHSSTSDLPAIIINKRCLYAACDNFQQFTDKITEFICGNRGDDADMTDDLVYENFMPVKYDSSHRLLEIKLESSLLQVLQQEMPYIQTDKKKIPINCRCVLGECQCPPINRDDPIQCSRCGLPWCICPCLSPGESKVIQAPVKVPQVNMPQISRSMELHHEREPQWDSFCRHVEPKKCSCAKTAKKHLTKHLPVYMRHLHNNYGPPAIPGYEICSVKTLKALVREAKEFPKAQQKVRYKYKDVGTQYEDLEFEAVCTCLTDSEIGPWLMERYKEDPSWMETGKVDSDIPTQLNKQKSSFATSRAYSLRNLVEDLPDLKEIFSRKDRAFE